MLTGSKRRRHRILHPHDGRPAARRPDPPASDKHVTTLEEVQIEARADDDYGIQSFELVFQTPKGKERVVPLRGARGGLTASGLHALHGRTRRSAGDFVTYFARARDVSRGRRATERGRHLLPRGQTVRRRVRRGTARRWGRAVAGPPNRGSKRWPRRRSRSSSRRGSSTQERGERLATRRRSRM